MSNDLISRSKVLKLIEDIKIDPNVPKNYATLLDISRRIKNMPTAYDVEIVERLKSHKAFYETKAAEYDEQGDIENMDIADAIALAYGKAIEIAKAGIA